MRTLLSRWRLCSYVMDLVNMLWRNRTLVPHADDPTLLFDAKQCQQMEVTSGRRGDNVTAADTSALKALRASFRGRVVGALSGSDITEENLNETLAMSQNWCCAGYARDFLAHKRQLVDEDASEEIILKPSQIKVRRVSTAYVRALSTQLCVASLAGRLQV